MKLHFVESMDEVLKIALEREIEWRCRCRRMLTAAEIVRSEENRTH